MKPFGLSVLFGLALLSLAFAAEENRDMKSKSAASKVTRKRLLAIGFKELATDRDVFVAEKVRLGDISQKLGFPLSSLESVFNQPLLGSDVRTVIVGNRKFGVTSDVRGSNGQVVSGSLDSPDALCTVRVSLKPADAYKPPKPPLPTDGNPHLHIKSVIVPENRKEPVRVAFELSTDGKRPLAVRQNQFVVRLMRGDTCAFEGAYGSFSKDTPGVIVVQPGKPLLLTIAVSNNFVTDGLWSDLDPGKYILRVVVSAERSKPGPPVDYFWRGVRVPAAGEAPAADERCSGGYTITIKGKEAERP